MESRRVFRGAAAFTRGTCSPTAKSHFAKPFRTSDSRRRSRIARVTAATSDRQVSNRLPEVLQSSAEIRAKHAHLRSSTYAVRRNCGRLQQRNSHRTHRSDVFAYSPVQQAQTAALTRDCNLVRNMARSSATARSPREQSSTCHTSHASYRSHFHSPPDPDQHRCSPQSCANKPRRKLQRAIPDRSPARAAQQQSHLQG